MCPPKRADFFPYLTCSDLKFEPHTGVFGFAESDFEVKIWKFKMVAPIWRTKIKNFTWFRWKFVLRDFWGRSLRIWTLNSKIQNGSPKLKILLDSDKNSYSGIFEVSYYESEHKIQKFQMVDLIWRMKMQKKCSIWIDLGTRGFSGSLNALWIWISQNLLIISEIRLIQ